MSILKTITKRAFSTSRRLYHEVKPISPSSAGVTESQRELQYRIELLERKLASPKTPDNEAMNGDYPNLPNISSQYRPQLGWWDNYDRRNFGQTLPDEDDALGVWAPDVTPPAIDPYMGARHFGLMVLAIATFGFIIKLSDPQPVAPPVTYPFDGLSKEFGGEGTIKHARKQNDEIAKQQEQEQEQS